MTFGKVTFEGVLFSRILNTEPLYENGKAGVTITVYL